LNGSDGHDGRIGLGSRTVLLLDRFSFLVRERTFTVGKREVIFPERSASGVERAAFFFGTPVFFFRRACR
jgi:hypothetical protein